MKRCFSLKRNKTFRYVYRKGKHAPGKLFRVHMAKSQRLQVGFSVSRQVGGAVTRNLVKRRLRECFRAQIPSLLAASYVVTANPEAAKASYRELCASMAQQLTRLGALRPRE